MSIQLCCGVDATTVSAWFSLLGRQAECMAWFQKPYPNGKNKGFVCFYCGRAWDGYYVSKPEYRTVTMFCTALGSDKNLHTEFFGIRHEGTLVFIDSKATRSFSKAGKKVNWDVLHTVVDSYDTQETVVTRDPDKWLEINEYRMIHGDPDTNGKNHERGWYQGHEAVKIPGALAWNVSTVNKQGVTKRTRHTDSNKALVGGEIERTFAGLSASLSSAFQTARGERAESMYAMMMRAGASSSGSSGSGMPTGGGAALPMEIEQGGQRDEGEDGGGMRFFGGGFRPAARRVPRAAEDAPAAKAKADPAGKRKPKRRISETDASSAESAGGKAKVGRPTSNKKQVLQDRRA